MNHSRIYRRFAAAAIAVLVLGLVPASALAVATDDFVVTVAGPVEAGTTHNVTVAAVLTGTTDPDLTYMGTVHFTSSDGAAVLPDDLIFTGGEGGTQTVSGVTLKTVGSGTQTVTATQTDEPLNTGISSPITVTPAPLNHLILTPSSSSITTDATQTYAVEGFDFYGNSLGDVTSSTNLTIVGTGTSCEDATHTCKSTTVGGPFTVTGTDGSATGTASLTVTVGALNHLVLSPPSSSITTDQTQTYSVEGFDANNNSRGVVTVSTTLTIVGTGTSCNNITHACKSTTVGGPFTVTGTDGSATGTASLTVTVGALDELELSPSSSSITTDATQTYAVEGFDANGNSRGDVTASTTLTIVGTGTSCNNITHACKSTTVGGPFTVTGTDGSATGTASLTVTVGALNHLVLSPSSSSITTDQTQTYSVEGFDANNNSRGVVTVSTTLTIVGTGTSCNNITHACKSTTVGGPFTVTGTDGSATGTASLTVTVGALHHLVLSPSTPSITAGGNQIYTAEGFDANNNSRGDVTGSTTFTISGTDSSCTGATCTSTLAGDHTVTGTDGSATGTASLHVNAGPLNHLVLAPSSSSITTDQTQTYTAEGFDVNNNSLGDVTALTTLTIVGTGTSCNNSTHTCQSTTPGGPFPVTGTDGSATGTASLTVTVGALNHLVLSPSSSSITAGGTQSYTAEGFDANNNTLGDVTGATTFTISGAGSSCTVATCTSTLAGDHTVTGTDSTATGTATLHVTVGTATHFTVGGLFSPRPTGVSGIVTVNAFDQFDNAATGYAGTVHITSSDSSATLPANGALSGGVGSFSVTLRTLGTQSVTATDTVTASITGSQAGIIVAANAAIPATYHPITPVRMVDSRTGNGLSGKLHANVPQTFQVSGRPGVPSNATAVTGNVTVVNSTNSWAVYLGPDPVVSPSTSTINFSAGEITGNGLTVALSGGGTLSATFISNGNNTTDLTFDVTGYFTPLGDNDADTYHPMTPTRLLDTRVGNGLSSKLPANTPRIFQVAGRGPVPSNAKAVTGNVTVVNSTNSWAVYLGPIPTATPSTSTINFSTGEIKANSLTVALGAGGSLSATFISTAGNTTDLVFDVTGYYTADTSGSKFVPLTPARLLDSRTGNGMSGKLSANTARTFQVSTRGGVPSNANGVTGNVTVVNETNSWAVFVGPTPTNSPSTSTLNFNKGDIKANGLTVALGTGGILSCTYISTAGNTTDLVFDVTGYFVP
jgi:hypothetical protein